jgi:RNA 3'-terminal phosphate cyclase (ATP)
VQAAAQICGADIGDTTVGSRTLEFVPKKVQGGEYKFAIGTAGSCTLVLQTVLPALLLADKPSVLHVSGGTHNPMAPPAQFLQRAYGRTLVAMGASFEMELKRFGFYPAGGGEIVVKVHPCKELKPLDLISRGERTSAFAESFVAGVPASVARRELECIGTGMGWDESQLLMRNLSHDQGPGNALMVTLEHQHVTEVFCGFGEKSLRAEAVAKQVLQQVRRYVGSNAAVGEYLADQLILPFALAGGGRFTTDMVSKHAQTNAEVISQFLPVDITFEEVENSYMCAIATR